MEQGFDLTRGAFVRSWLALASVLCTALIGCGGGDFPHRHRKLGSSPRSLCPEPTPSSPSWTCMGKERAMSRQSRTRWRPSRGVLLRQ